MKIRLRHLFYAGTFTWSILFTAACQVAAKNTSQPARLIDPTNEVFTEIREVINKALNGAEVKLATRFFVDSSWLTIERTAKKTIQNPNLLGRSDEAPISFQLLKLGKKCVIKKSDNERLWALKLAQCQVIKKDD